MMLKILKSENFSYTGDQPYPGEGGCLLRLKRALARKKYRAPTDFDTQ